MSRTDRYILDTSAIADMLERFYPAEVFPQVTRLLERLAEAGRLVVPADVRDELGSSSVVAWLDGLTGVVADFDEPIQTCLHRIMADVGSRMLDHRGTKNGADPIVIAFAMAKEGTVVTSEKSNKASKWVKLPDACESLGVSCVNVMGLFTQEKDLLY